MKRNSKFQEEERTEIKWAREKSLSQAEGEMAPLLFDAEGVVLTVR
jgi:hypothetical protein